MTDLRSISYIKHRATRAPPCRLARGYGIEYLLNDNIYLDCIYSTVAGAVRNSNRLSWWNILTADDVHLFAWLSVAGQSEILKIALGGLFTIDKKEGSGYTTRAFSHYEGYERLCFWVITRW